MSAVPSHAGELVIEAEVILEGGGRERLTFALDGDAFLGLDGLVQAFGEPASRHGAPGVLVDQHHFAVAHDVFDIAMKQMPRAQRVMDMVQQPQVDGLVEAVLWREQSGVGEQPFDFFVTGFGEFHLAGADPAGLAEVPHIEYVREAGSEGIELVMWLIARGAMGDLAGGAPPRVAHRFYHVPASNTAVGHLILENPQ